MLITAGLRMITPFDIVGSNTSAKTAKVSNTLILGTDCSPDRVEAIAEAMLAALSIAN
jgi:hypothetical protein